jgi:chromosome segregation ATPase
MVLDDKAEQALRKEVQALRGDKAATETKNEELKLTHLRQETKINQLRKDINELTADNETLCDAYNEVNRINATLRNNYNEVSGINTTLRDNVTALNTNIDQWEKYAFGERDQLTKQYSYTDELEKRLETADAHVGDLEECNEDLEDRLVMEKIDFQVLEAEYKELERKNQALWSTVKYLDGLVDEDQAEVMRMRRGVLKLKKLWELGELD